MAIEVGDAIWRIKGDSTDLDNTLKKTEQSIGSSFKRASLVAGAAMTAIGGVITGITTKAVMDFVSLGSEINDMALRTGFGTTALQELGYAAGLSGGSMADVELAAKKMSKVIFDAGEESKKAATGQAEAFAKGSNEIVLATGASTDALAYLGLTYDMLASQSPEQQFMTIGFAIADVADETARAALAQEFFGRSGTSLLPMLSEGRAGFAAMSAEAARLGLIMSQEDIAAADALGDSMDKLKASLSGVMRDIAIVVIPSLQSLADSAQHALETFSAWRDRNPELADSVVKLVIALGGIMVVLGPILMALPGLIAAWGGVSAAFTFAGTVIAGFAAAIGAPVAAVVAALVGAGLLIWAFWEDIAPALTWVWRSIVDSFMAQWSVIYDFIIWLRDVGMGILNGVSGFFGGGVSGPQIPGMATGGTVQKSGWAMVGERGPELVQMPQGATVYDAGQTDRAITGAGTGTQPGQSVVVNFNRDSVRSDEDIRFIERAITRIIGSGITANGTRALA